MASEKYVPLIKLGPFDGVDATTADPFEASTFANTAPNVDPFRSSGAMATAPGRLAYITLTGSPGATTIDALAETAGYNFEQGAFMSLYVSNNGANKIVYASPLSPTATQTAVANGRQFYQAVAYEGYVITNTGQQLWSASAYTLQQPAPTFMPTLSSTAGNIPAGTISYTFTYEVTIGSSINPYQVQETSPSTSAFPVNGAFPLSITTSVASQITLSLASGAFSGTFPDGSTYVTNVYRQSTNQPTWYLVGQATGTTFIDNNSDIVISDNEVLDTNRDAPPAGPGAVIFSHRDRMFFFVDVAAVGGGAISQLWYSDYGLPYEFNAAEQVLLVGPDSLEGGGTLTPGTLVANGDFVQNGVSISGVALLFKHYKTYILDGVDEATFYVSLLADIGCEARNSVAVGVQTAYWLSERGVESWSLGAPVTYISEQIREILETFSATDRIAAVGWYSNQAYFISFPTQERTFVYRVQVQKWREVPYAASAVISLPANIAPGSSPTSFGSVLAVRPNTVDIDSWQAAETDLGLPITATWVAPLSDSEAVWLRKEYRFCTVGAPIQPGVTLTVQLETWDVGAKQPASETLEFDLGLAAYQTQSWPDTVSRGNYAQVTVTLTNTATATSPALVYSVIIGGGIGPGFEMASA